jgi:hypothetical protein
METHVEFRTDLFPRYADKSEGINRDRWGRRLAEFLRAGLKNKGFEIAQPYAQDWGWVVPIEGQPFELWIGCGNYDQSPDGFLCFIEPNTPRLRKRFRQFDTTTRVTALRNAIDGLLINESGVREIRWLG